MHPYKYKFLAHGRARETRIIIIIIMIQNNIKWCASLICPLIWEMHNFSILTRSAFAMPIIHLWHIPANAPVMLCTTENIA